MDGLL
jgi:hypothetical protein